ncbi:DEHA2D06061p protein, partial [Puccinia sorghi]
AEDNPPVGETPGKSWRGLQDHNTCYQSCPNTPNWPSRLGHQNRKYQSLMVPNSEIVDCDLSNLTLSITRNLLIPFHTWTGCSFNWEVLRPFGYLIYSLIPKERRNFKLNPTVERGIMLGSENDFSSYCIFRLEERKVVRSSDHQVETGVTKETPKAPRDISSQVSTDNILSVDRRRNSVIVYLTKNAVEDIPASYIQTINSTNSSFWKKAIEKEVTN